MADGDRVHDASVRRHALFPFPLLHCFVSANGCLDSLPDTIEHGWKSAESYVVHNQIKYHLLARYACHENAIMIDSSSPVVDIECRNNQWQYKSLPECKLRETDWDKEKKEKEVLDDWRSPRDRNTGVIISPLALFVNGKTFSAINWLCLENNKTSRLQLRREPITYSWTRAQFFDKQRDSRRPSQVRLNKQRRENQCSAKQPRVSPREIWISEWSRRWLE